MHILLTLLPNRLPRFRCRRGADIGEKLSFSPFVVGVDDNQVFKTYAFVVVAVKKLVKPKPGRFVSLVLLNNIQ